MNHTQRALFTLLCLVPSLAWADIAPEPEEIIMAQATNPLVFIPVLILFFLGVGAVVFVMKKKRDERTS